MTTTEPPAAPDPEATFLSCLPAIDRIVAAIARRHALDASDAEEFGAWAKARLIEDGYRVFVKFSGRSSLSTYLTVVLSNLYRDYRNAQWGRWRPSAAARRLGPVALRLEALVFRDGHSAREAIALVRARGVTLSNRELQGMLSQIPVRVTVRETSLQSAAHASAREDASTGVDDDEAEAERAAIMSALDRSVKELASEEQVIMRMHYWDGWSVADIARTLHLEQKPLYRRLEDLRARLRRELLDAGVSAAQVSALVEGAAM